MIPFASQRGSGQDLATHLLNEHDNEYMEMADLRGAVADDLHGAFAEWEAEASAMTKCMNYLYSLSINPDPAQGPMSRELYDDYIARVEQALGLEGQPRAVVFHIKEDQAGVPREHCHVVWSRIDVQEMKAIQMSFDHDKLMTMTRQFARDHDIQLAPGYYKLEDRQRQTHRQLSLYEKVQLESTGLSSEERRNLITELWHGRDTPASFIKALEHHGYVLATGGRPYVLVDIYGHTNSLPKLIDDKAANTKAIRAFLGEAYVEENLPSVEEAQALARDHRENLKAFKQSEKRADKIDELKVHQSKRRETVEREVAVFLDKQKHERTAFEGRHRVERDTQRSDYLEQVRAVRQERHENKPQGLAGFLSRVTGMEQVRHKLHRYQDKQRYDAFLADKHQTQSRQETERLEHQRAQEMQALDIERKRRGLEKTEQRELKSLETSFEKQQAIRYRNGYEHMPSLQLELSPPGRKAVPHKAKNRFTSEVGRELNPPRKIRTRDPSARENTVHEQFGRAANGESDKKNGTNTQGALEVRSNPSSQDHEIKPPISTPSADPKVGEGTRENHIDRAIQAYDHAHEKPVPLKPTPPQAPNPVAPEIVPEQEALPRIFEAAAIEKADPDKGSGDHWNNASPQANEPEEPDITYGPKPPDTEPDRER